MPAFIDLTGQKYGKLTVIALHPKKCSSGRTQWLCRCECGNEKIIRGNDLRRGRTTSCGCNVITHGHTRNQANGRRYTPEYISWYSMRQRCKNPNHFAYKDYGGRGITICERWESFENFLKDTGALRQPGNHRVL